MREEGEEYMKVIQKEGNKGRKRKLKVKREEKTQNNEEERGKNGVKEEIKNRYRKEEEK